MFLRSALLATMGAALCSGPAQAEPVVDAPVAKLKSQDIGKRETAVFAGGCFWGVEAVFSHMKGVTSVVSGFTGGAHADADYATVSRGGTAHAEAVKVTWDPKRVRYDQLLQVYFSVIADPTLLNRQGPDVGSHYRSALVPLNAEQARIARAYMGQLREAGLWSRPIVTKLEPFRGFFPAADAHHQDFMHRNPRHGYIVRWDAPKVAALKKLHPALYKSAFTTG